jgi:Asp-tRNA(Asn)/Glu-tRNA(Gln) amidotransferase A subunit family amidase
VDFRRTTVAEIADQVTNRELSAREVVRAALERIERHDAELGA